MNEKQFIKVFWLAKASLIVILAYAGFRAITGHLHIGALDPAVVSGDERPADVPPPTPRRPSSCDYGAIIENSLFAGPDEADQLALDSGSSQLDAMPSAEQLGLRLVGAIVGGPAISRANIQDIKTKTTGVYRIGDTVASAKVEAIQRDAVVLCHEGRQLILRLSAAGGDKAPASSEGQPAEPPPAPAGVKTARPPIKADYISEVFHKATIEPYVKNNQTQGLQISGLDKIPMAELFGFKNGDIIQSVNGQQLTNKQKAFQVLMKAKTQSKVDIQLLRNGKSKALSFDR
ncbi:MAG: PDZ domain-containing protein [Phycisphaerae bacterium]|nr:PDZ domain-containing protein [Phycisphaerae bacterium]